MSIKNSETNAIVAKTASQSDARENTNIQSGPVGTTENVSMVKTQPDVTATSSSANVLETVSSDNVSAAVSQMLDEKGVKHHYIDTPYFRVDLKVLGSASATKTGVILKNRSGTVEGFARFSSEKIKLLFLSKIMNLLKLYEADAAITADDLDMTEFFS